MKNYNTVTADRGSAAAPAYAFNDKTNSGMYGRSDGGIAFALNGAETVVYTPGARYQNIKIGYTLNFYVADAPTDQKYWRWSYSGTTMSLDCINDAYTAGAGAMSFTRSGTVVTDTKISGSFYNLFDATFSLGTSGFRWKDLFLVNQPTVSSDVSGKVNIRNLNTAEVNAWSNISPRIYQLQITGGVTSPLLSAGLIAQEVLAQFAAAGLDATKYNLFDQDAATGKYLLKYGECAMFEAAYQRTRVAEMQTALNALKSSLNSVLSKLAMPVLP